MRMEAFLQMYVSISYDPSVISAKLKEQNIKDINYSEKGTLEYDFILYSHI